MQDERSRGLGRGVRVGNHVRAREWNVSASLHIILTPHTLDDRLGEAGCCGWRGTQLSVRAHVV